MINDVLTLIEQRGFRNLGINAQGMYVDFLLEEETAKVLILLECKKGDELIKEQYENVCRQIRSIFIERGAEKVDALSLLFTENVDRIKDLCDSWNSSWVIDMPQKKLLLYEGQPSDFCGIKKMLEEYLLEGASIIEDTPTVEKKSMALPKIGILNAIMTFALALAFLLPNLLLSPQAKSALLSNYSLSWKRVFEFGEVYRIVTYLFIHGNIEHIANNLIVLYFVGDTLEKLVGHTKYILIFFISGILAGLTSMIYNMYKGILVSGIGASGAVFGVIGAVAVLLIQNRNRIKEMSLIRIILFVGVSLYGGFTAQGIDNVAHVGGLLAGMLTMYVLGKLFKKKEV